MAAQKGRSFVLKISNNLSPATFTTLAGLRETDFTINGEAVDITNKDSAGFRTLLAGAGVASLSISGAGVFDNDAAQDTVRERARDMTLDEYQITFGNGDTLEVTAQITSYGRSGSHDGEEQYSVSLESSGQWNYNAA